MSGIVKFTARAAAWRATAEPPLVGLPTLLTVAAIVAAVRTALQLLAAGSWHSFNPYGLNAVAAWIALELAVAALFVRPAGRATALSALFLLSLVAELGTAAIKLGLPLLLPAIAQNPRADAIATDALYAVAVLWWIGAVAKVVQSFQIVQSFRSVMPLSSLGRAAGLWLALFAANAVVPHAPVFLPPHFDARSANWWEVFYALRAAQYAKTHALPPELAQLEDAQPGLLKTELSRLAPQRPGVTDVYALGIAGWGEQDVFRKELDGGLAAMADVLPIQNHVVRLVNNRSTLGTLPLADVANFQAAVHGIAQVMDKNEDVLVLMMTSHGEQTGFALELPSGVAELTPQQIATTLDKEGVKNRVVIVSACYAGIFLPPLKNDDSIVITAADAHNTSFGCAPENDWTYFGDAFFRQSLHPGSDFENSFDHARVLIQGWELMDHVHPSNPQAWFGPAVVAKLQPYFATDPGQ